MGRNRYRGPSIALIKELFPINECYNYLGSIPCPKIVKFDASTNKLSSRLLRNVCKGGVPIAFIVFIRIVLMKSCLIF